MKNASLNDKLAFLFYNMSVLYQWHNFCLKVKQKSKFKN